MRTASTIGAISWTVAAGRHLLGDRGDRRLELVGQGEPPPGSVVEV
jgi:hypothetical protein